MAMLDLQYTLETLIWSKNVEDKVVFFYLKSAKSFSLLLKARNAQVTFAEKSQFLKQKHGVLIHSWSDKALKSTLVNRALPSLHGGSLEITLAVPSRQQNFLFVTCLGSVTWNALYRYRLHVGRSLPRDPSW